MVQSDGAFKVRPALILKILPGYGDLLICGISSKLKQEPKGIDEILHDHENYFSATGLHQTSLIRLLSIAVEKPQHIAGSSGNISDILHNELLKRLAKFLTS